MCGMNDVRKDEIGYFCFLCGRRMPEYYRALVMCAGRKYLKQLDEQCSLYALTLKQNQLSPGRNIHLNPLDSPYGILKRKNQPT